MTHTIIDPSLQNSLTELMSKSLNSDQIDHIGRLLLKHFDSHTLLDVDHHITLSSRRAAEALVLKCVEKQSEDKLFKFLIESDGEEILGKTVNFPELESFMNKLARSGYVYDFHRRKLKRIRENLDDMPNWGSLRDGKIYDISVASIDIVGNSKIVKKHGLKKAEKLYFRFWTLLRRVLSVYEGRIWSWAGDGGIVAFTFKKHTTRAVLWALEMQNLMPVFNVDPDRVISDPVQLRIGVDTGRIKYMNDPGKIVSETINYAAHLEKYFTKPGCVSISDTVRNSLPKEMLSLYLTQDEFEERTAYQVYCRDPEEEAQ